MKDFQKILNSIICGNNVETLKSFPDECIDLTVTSPPYDGIRNYNKKLNVKQNLIGNYCFPFEELAKELFRVTKIGGVVVWNVNDQVVDGNNEGKTETGNSFRQVLYFQSIGFNIHDTMIYEKPAIRFPDSTRYHQCFEYMFILSKGKPKSINLIKDRKNKSFNRFETKEASRQCRGEDDDLIKNVNIGFDGNVLKEFGIRFNFWKINTEQTTGRNVNEYSWHPAIFPSKLAYDHIVSWSNEGDTVLDPFSGSGTTSIQAKILKRNYVGIDINEEYVKQSTKIIENYSVLENQIEDKNGIIENFIEF